MLPVPVRQSAVAAGLAGGGLAFLWLTWERVSWRGLAEADAPWRAARMTYRNWGRWQASGLSRADYRQKFEQGYPRADQVEALDAKVSPRDTSADCRRLASVTLEITDEPVTEGRVESVLGWLEGHKGRLKSTDKKYADELTVEETLYVMDFVQRNWPCRSPRTCFPRSWLWMPTTAAIARRRRH